jgi:predicted dehydrogenase
MSASQARRPLRYGMVGGGRNAFIGAVHRAAAALDQQAVLTAGALSSDPARARDSARDLGIADERAYGSWQDLLAGELARPEDDRIDFVVIVTPNDVHFPVAKAAVEAGFHVVCDKPLVHSSEQASELVSLVQRAGTVFAVTYNYTGYPLVRHARDMVANGELGELRKVVVQYSQGWLATRLEATGNKQAEWRTDPARSGIAGAMGDIGSHAENLAATITGRHITHVSADVATVVPGRLLDDDAAVLLRLQGDVRGLLVASQIEIGNENNLRIRVHGSDGSLSWRQEDPNLLLHAPASGPARELRRGNDYLSASAQKATRIPPGHPEGYLEAFANVYLGVFEAIRAKQAGRELAPLDGQFPTVEDGARGVRFIERVIESARSGERWTEV